MPADLKVLAVLGLWCTLGGAVLALREEAFPLNQKTLDNFDELGEKIATKGARNALKLAMPFIEGGLKEMSSAARDGFRDQDEKQR